MDIRPEQRADEAAIDRVVDAAFARRNEARLVGRLRDTGRLRHPLVACENDTVIGYVVASPITIDPPAPEIHALGIAPLAVDPSRQGTGIGSALMRAIVDAAIAAGWDVLFLLGNPGYYHRFGFVTSTLGNEFGATDAFMQRELEADCLASIEATVRYDAAFRLTGT